VAAIQGAATFTEEMGAPNITTLSAERVEEVRARVAAMLD